MLDAHHSTRRILEPSVRPLPSRQPEADKQARRTRPVKVPCLPEYVGASHVHIDSQPWPGAFVAVANIHAQNSVSVNLEGGTNLILVSLEEVGSPLWVREKNGPRTTDGRQRRSISVIPAGAPVEGEALRPQYLRHLLLCLDRSQLEEDFGGDVDIDKALTQRLMHSDDRLLRVVRLVAEECAVGGQVDRLFAEGLMLALLSSLAAIEDPAATAGWSRGGLAPWQLRRVTEYLLENLAEDVDLDDLAASVELSKSHFSRGFRESTGSPPHRWLLNARIDKAKALLLSGQQSLADIALEVGFADQSHFTRTFTKFVSVSPRAWLRQRL